MTSFIHALPIEAWYTILSFACTDDGSTGRSISLVSRYLHHACKPFKYQSIYLLGAFQIIKFAQMLTRLNKREQNIRRLLIACPKLVFSPTQPKSGATALKDQDGEVVASALMDPYIRELMEQRRATKLYEFRITSAITSIIGCSESTLISLSICLDFALHLPLYRLPKLQALVLYAPVSNGFFDNSAFPSLKRLRLGPQSMPDAEHLLLGCPRLDFLHVHDSARLLERRLQLLLKGSAELRQVVIQMDDTQLPMAVSWNGEMAKVIRSHLVGQLKKVAEEDRRVVLVSGEEKAEGKRWMEVAYDLPVE